MLNVFRGSRPDITPAQVTAIVAAVAQFLRAFGIYDVTPDQQDALNVASGLLLAVVLGDVGIRAARNSADAKRDAAALTASSFAASPSAPPADLEHDELMAKGEDLPSDDEEFALEPGSRLTPDDPDRDGQ